jgi:hypothetical protein
MHPGCILAIPNQDACAQSTQAGKLASSYLANGNTQLSCALAAGYEAMRDAADGDVQGAHAVQQTMYACPSPGTMHLSAPCHGSTEALGPPAAGCMRCACCHDWCCSPPTAALSSWFSWRSCATSCCSAASELRVLACWPDASNAPSRHLSNLSASASYACYAHYARVYATMVARLEESKAHILGSLNFLQAGLASCCLRSRRLPAYSSVAHCCCPHQLLLLLLAGLCYSYMTCMADMWT